MSCDPYYGMGYNHGYQAGRREGYEEGYRDGYAAGFRSGYEKGYMEGYENLRQRIVQAMRDILRPERIARCGSSMEEAVGIVRDMARLLQSLLQHPSVILEVLPVLAEKSFHSASAGEVALEAARVLDLLSDRGDRLQIVGPSFSGETEKVELLPYAWAEIQVEPVQRLSDGRCVLLGEEEAAKIVDRTVRLVIDKIGIIKHVIQPVGGDPGEAAKALVEQARASATSRYYQFRDEHARRLVEKSLEACERNKRDYERAVAAARKVESQLSVIPPDKRELIGLIVELAPHSETILYSSGKIESEAWVEGIVRIEEKVDTGSVVSRLFSKKKRELHKRLVEAKEWAENLVREVIEQVEEETGVLFGVEITYQPMKR